MICKYCKVEMQPKLTLTPDKIHYGALNCTSCGKGLSWAPYPSPELAHQKHLKLGQKGYGCKLCEAPAAHSNGAPNEDELGALWEKSGPKCGTYMTGTINGVKVIVFRNQKKNSDKQPDWKVLKSKPKGERSHDDSWGDRD